MITSVFSQFPALACRHARHSAGQGRCELQRHQTPESHQAARDTVLALPPCPAVGSSSTPHRASAELWALPWACCLQGSGAKQIHVTGQAGREIIDALYEAERCQKESIVSAWTNPGLNLNAGDAPTTAQLGMHLDFPAVTQAGTLCGILARQILCWTCRHHTSEIAGKTKTTIQGERPGKRIRMICWLYEASVELQQVRKESLSGMSELLTFSYYTPDFCL